MITVKQEIDRLYNLSQDQKWCRYNMSSEAPYYHDLCSVEDKTITLDMFYNIFPYYNPDRDSDFWKKQHNRWKEIWTEKN
jgi:hypothetical protein